ncbi:hypothetical protein AUK04_00980 [Candidatus Roizmanbacteria bacterium CG2_30_33_16]|uniref:Uncharacterized protein n=1 Tax=Candidatus Roizmanbacteria bacterium CG2_30_33_16 TaxID=1805340 RepID=A0A1J5HN72_9BACT|nr:MAG: hypothetical protein AUK04_00980 [Candidatus Roizmanbacteria bacterium CG2_30_33_16]
MSYRKLEYCRPPLFSIIKDYIRTCNVVHPDSLSRLPELLRQARSTFQEGLCAKDVYGAMVIELKDDREVICLSRNGMESATPKHLDRYSVNNLRNLAIGIKNPEDRNKLLTYLDSIAEGEQDLILNCRILATRAGCEWCLVGHGIGYDKGDEHHSGNGSRVDRRTTSEACPNLHAGCTERILLYNRPYLIGLMKKIEGKKITVTDIFYYDKKSPPVLTYYEGEEIDNPHSIIIEEPEETVEDIKKLALFTQTCPCQTCVQAFVDFKKETGVSPVIVCQYLSRHQVKEVQGVDKDDVRSLNQLMAHQIPVCWQEVESTIIKWRSQLNK